MHKAIHLENKFKYLNTIMISGILFLLIIFIFKPNCLFMEYFNIPCVACGMTRAFKLILSLKIFDALKMNLLSVILFIYIIINLFLYIIFLLLKKDYIYKFNNYFIKHYKIILVVLFINWIINIVKHLYYLY